MAIEFERITPAKAESWLNHNQSNRKLRDGHVEKLAEDMRKGRWTKCTVPISFYDDGDIADGQHRLWAIIESNTTQSFMVLRGLTRADGLNIDTGMARSVVDNGRISGVDKGLSNELVATARAIHVGGPNFDARISSIGAKLEVVALHREAAEWACRNTPKGKYLKNAVVMGAIGRAYYYIDVDQLSRLKRFCDVMTSGLPANEGEFAAIALRNYLLAKGPLSTTTALWVDTFAKVQNAIAYFMRGKSLGVIKGQSEEQYPLPPKYKNAIALTPKVRKRTTKKVTA